MPLTKQEIIIWWYLLPKNIKKIISVYLNTKISQKYFGNILTKQYRTYLELCACRKIAPPLGIEGTEKRTYSKYQPEKSSCLEGTFLSISPWRLLKQTQKLVIINGIYRISRRTNQYKYRIPDLKYLYVFLIFNKFITI